MSTIGRLSEKEKIKTVLNQGVFLHSINWKGKEADLYSLDSQWVEVVLCPLSNRLLSIHTIDYAALDKYLAGDISSLLQ